ncbi:MAG: GNAT family N-acetyltransferase [Cyanobacteria bacterium P01_A01_bin.84]
MQLRQYQISDTQELAFIYRDAAINTGSQVYTPEQISTWSSYPDSREEFQNRLMEGLTIVAIEHSQPVAFGQLYPQDHIALLYTASKYNRMGYATKIYQNLESYAIAHHVNVLRTEASRISKHFFLKVGFEVTEVEMANFKGIIFERFKMEKALNSTIAELNSEQLIV